MDQWSPTSVQVTAVQARGLRAKGKHGTNDAYAVMQVGKEKFQTSVVEKSVAPVWKEEAAFELGRSSSTLQVHVLHRALVGPDKLPGQALIDLVLLSEDTGRDKTAWFKLLDKTGKSDKDRGEVLVDIQFMRNNMTASMFDLSAAGKSKSRLGKFKDKVRGKKKESDASSVAVPTFSQVLTDSEEEGKEAAEKDEEEGKKKKHKMKSLFAPKSNLQKNLSQSMTVLPGRNPSFTGSLSSLNVEPSEGKKKFKFLKHKRSDSRDSQKQAEQSNLCINGSHVYCEEPQPRSARTGSNFSLTSSGHGSMEDVPESSPPSVESLRVVKEWTEEQEEAEASVNEMECVEDDGGLEGEEGEEGVGHERFEEIQSKEEEQSSEEGQNKVQKMLRRFEKRQERREVNKLVEGKQKTEVMGAMESGAREEERIRKEKEMAEEEKRRQERIEEERRLKEEQERLEEERKVLEEKLQREEEERVEQRRKEEEQERLERNRIQEEERIQKEEIKKEQEEKQRREEQRKAEEERTRKEEELRRAAEEKRQEEERKQIEEERIKREQEERLRKEMEEKRLEEERKLEEQKKQMEHERMMEEERARKEMEEEEKRRKEERKLEEERRRMEHERMMKEERARKEMEEKEERKLEEERRRMEHERMMEEERARKEMEEEKRREEEKKLEERRRVEQERMMEEERARKEMEEKRREEERKLEEEKRRQVEQERMMEEERLRKELEEKRRDEERKLEEERLKKEENLRLELEEKRRVEEEEARIQREKERMEEEERIRKEEMERKRQEEEALRREEEEKVRAELLAEKKRLEENRRREEQTRLEEERNRKEELDEEKNLSDDEAPGSPAVVMVLPRCQLDSSEGSEIGLATDCDSAVSQRKKLPAPQPPGRNPAVRRQDSDESQVTMRPVPRRVGVAPQRPADSASSARLCPTNTKSMDDGGRVKHAKGPAPSRPSHGLKSVSPLSKSGPSLNPFDEDDDEDTVYLDQKTRSSKVTRAPKPPANPTTPPSSNPLTENSPEPSDGEKRLCDPERDSGLSVSFMESSPHKPVPQQRGDESQRRAPPPATPRRLQPVKPLKAVEDQDLGQNVKCTSAVEEQSKQIKRAEVKGPYSLLTQEELVGLVQKQEKQLSDRDKKIAELEQYIDNLLVHVMEEQPSILMSLTSMRKAV